MAVSLGGGILSSTLFELLCSSSDKEGLLVGDASIKIRSEINDQQIDGQSETATYEVKRMIPFPKPRSFYDKRGRILESKISILIKDVKDMQIIGWYKCRQNTKCKMSLMEKMVTRELQSYFSKKMFGVEPLFALFTAEHNNNSCNVVFDYSFLLPLSSTWIPITVHVTNLGETSSQYKTENHTDHTLDAYQLVLQRFSGEDRMREQDNSVKNVTSLSKELLDQLSNLSKDVQQSEKELESMQQENNILRTRLCTTITASKSSSGTKAMKVDTVPDTRTAAGPPAKAAVPPIGDSSTPDLIDLSDVITSKVNSTESKDQSNVSEQYEDSYEDLTEECNNLPPTSNDERGDNSQSPIY